MTVDVAILGAGPAGLATALTLQRHAPQRSVAVLGGAIGARRGQVGETLPPGLQSTLTLLGVWEAFLATHPLEAFGTCAAWGGAEAVPNEFIFHPDRRGWHIDRESFDAMLATEARHRGVEVHPGAPLSDAARLGDDWLLRTRESSGATRELRARLVIDATGRAAVLASRAGATRVADDRLVAIAVTFRAAAGRRWSDTYTLVEACADGWWYSSLLPDGDMAVVFFTDADLARAGRWKEAEAWGNALHRAPQTRARVVGAEPKGEPVLRAADSGLLDRLTGEGWLAAGDAASTVDPLSSQGIAKALKQGMLAAYAAADHLAGDGVALRKYEAVVRREHQGFLATKRDIYREEDRWVDSPFWRRRHDRIWLRPGARVQRQPLSRGVPPLHFTPSDLERLCRGCAQPRRAHELVAAFVTEAGPVTDERTIQALQHLIESGAVNELQS